MIKSKIKKKLNLNDIKSKLALKLNNQFMQKVNDIKNSDLKPKSILLPRWFGSERSNEFRLLPKLHVYSQVCKYSEQERT